MFRLLYICLFTLLISGCSILDDWTYKVNKQQGNITEQKHVDQLEIGMTKEQVKFLLGTSMSIHTFDHDRWDYIYTYKAGNDEPTRNNLTVYFENNALSKIEGEALVKTIVPKKKVVDEADADNEDEDES
jgi:outer membrane protein assembly factor BamE